MEMNFKERNMVYMKIQPYWLKSLANKTNQKLSPRQYGSHEMIEWIGAMNYKLKLPPRLLGHPLPHISLLNECVPFGLKSQPLPLGLTEEWELRVQTTEILAVGRN